MKSLRTTTLTLAALALASGVGAHVPLENPANGNDLTWSTPGNISIVINSTGSDNISDDSHFTAIRNGIAAWNDVTGSSLQLVENTNATQQARTDWTATDIHLVMFDETNASGFFPGGSGTVAVTPVFFMSNGNIVDADILFNGSGFTFTTSGAGGAFDVQDVVTHELGHLVGLDHSGIGGATMYPYVSPGVVVQRSLAIDDANGIRTIYPSGALGSITGTVRRASDSSIVQGALVVARDPSGRTAGSILSNASGAFTIGGLDPDTYTVYAKPFDFPVSSANLGGLQPIETDFRATVGSSVPVSAGASASHGDLNVGSDVAIGLGRNTDLLPLAARIGTTTTFALAGAGLSAGSTLTPSDGSIGISVQAWLNSQVVFQVTVPPGASTGHVDLTVTNVSAETSTLPGAIEIVPPDPAVTLVNPSQGPSSGGTAVTLTGTGFRAGARVVIGDQIYVDGAPGGCTVVDPTTITLTTAASTNGTYDVVVIDASGVEGRNTSGFQFVTQPTVTSVFPDIGNTAGGTEVVLRGTNFLSGMSVLINGVSQSNVVVTSPTRATFTTVAGATGGPYTLSAQNPGGGTGSGAFSYSSSPDPVISTLSPSLGPAGGGAVITLNGTGLSASTEVRFNVDPDTGTGGTLSPSITFINSTTLEVTTPSGSGTVDVMTRDTGTNQACVLANGYTFNTAGGGGGGSSGGGCYTAPYSDPFDAHRIGPGLLGWILAAAGVAALAARARRRSAAHARERATR